MFNIGPLELVVLALVGIIVLGPDRIPGVARDAARMIRQLRDMATGARSQLKNELGPEFADVGLDSLRELRSLNPRTAIQRALLGDDDEVVDVPRDDAPADTAAAAPPAQQPLGRGDKAPFDEDAT
ncbi:MAG TPA: sec-independent translocase [Jatrophihabitantaceae bacterium]|nr:sec-independent translocase [Jatrophihabitantaceae bacterium]